MQRAVCAPPIEEFCHAIDSKSSRRQYAHRLNDFDKFLKIYNTPIDSFIVKAKSNVIDLYKIIGEYRIQLKEKQGLRDQTIGSRIATLKHFLEFNDVPINSTKFRLKVKPPKRKQRTIGLKALDSALVRKIILACQDTRLQTYVLLLAATGMRATEALSIRYEDIDWEAATVTLREEYTKTQEARTVFLTEECMKYLKLWKDYRERTRRIVNPKTRKIKLVNKIYESDDLFFATARGRRVTNPYNLYCAIEPEFRKALDLNGLSQRYDNKGKRHKITFHRFRSFVKSTISDLGYQDFSEYYIGHSGSTYYRKTDAEKLAIFKKVEPYLTYLDYTTLEAKGADVETKLQEKDDRISKLEEQMNSLQESLNRFLKTEKPMPLEIISHALDPTFEGRDPKRPLSEWRKDREALDRKYGISEDRR